MNNVNMGGMNAMGGPVGGGMPMMNNGAGGARQPMPPNNNDQRSQLNTYIYEYFLRNGMYDCARSLLNSEQPINVEKDSPGRRRENGTGDEGGDGDNKDDIDSKQPNDLPNPAIPKECPESCFLYEWWCLFWDMFNAQRGKGDARSVLQYVTHTQGQSRLKQEQQQQMLRGLRNDMTPQQYQQLMMRNSAAGNGMNLNQNELRHKAIQNNNRNATPQQLQMLQAQQQAQKQQQMQRDPSEGNNQQRPQSPGSAENAPSPSKRPRLDGTPFNPQQVPNGRGQAGGMPQQFQNMPGGPNAQQARLAGYQQNLAQQQAGQMPGVNKPMPNPGGPQNQGSPMMTQGQDGAAIANYYNPQDPNRMQGPGGAPGGSGGNHALQDYQMQLMLLEQQNKKRLMMARQEQDNMIPRPEGGQGGGPGPVGPNGQPFQQGTSPQGPRSVNSPNPGDQMKRGTPHMNNAGMPSPLPEGQSRGSPSNGMNFNLPGGQMDPNMNPQYFKMNGMDPNMAGVMPNGMRPPSSHPGGFNGQMTPQQMAMARQQQQQVQNWQGPNGQMMPQPASGGAPQQNMGTPQQRAMPPPSAPAANPAANGRTQPPSPQQNPAPPTPSQTNKANPKKKAESKDSKAKRATKKGSTANLNAGATPSADAENAGATPTPATPITPVHPKSFQNGAVQPVTNGQAPAPAANAGVVPQQPDPLQGGALTFDSSAFDFQGGMDFANPGNGNMDVLQDFDFDSFLHQDGEGVDQFNFDSAAFLDGNEIGAE
ncbi:hypothetical protein ONS96_005091 [Cadophora gregata f. sp. sojae]|nr:hypothetical protein ONS96_005091 [Cadophora gregata f. sp. sojae]